MALLLAVLLPALYWDHSPEKLEALKRAGIERIYRPGDAMPSSEKLPPPGVQYRMDVASATHIPWIDSNGWRFQRSPGRVYRYDVNPRTAALAAAEAVSWGADAILHLDGEETAPLTGMVAFLAHIGAPNGPVMADIGVTDDGSPAGGEVLNLLARYNLLFAITPSKDATIDLHTAKQDPLQAVRDVRARITDSKRRVRVFGSDVVLVHLTGDGRQARLHLLNYSGRKVMGLRVRVRGEWQEARPALSGVEQTALLDLVREDGAIEFSLPELNTYGIVDLSGK